MDDLGKQSHMGTIFHSKVLDKLPVAAQTELPVLPATETWVNLKTLGATGDGETDDTKAIQSMLFSVEMRKK